MTSMSEHSLDSRYDSVLMLTWSDWHTEMRSNRYHYATRFARHLPVLFVQPDLPMAGYSFEATEVPGIEILHVFAEYGPRQDRLLNEALLERGRLKPLLWIYNFYFVSFIQSRFAPRRVYHATEDYFCRDFISMRRLDDLRAVLGTVDLVVAVSEGVRDSYRERGGYNGECLVLPNGCDYDFWSAAPVGEAPPRDGDAPPVALYQGGISHKLDWDLLEQLTAAMPDWEFWFCGEVFNCHDEWSRLTKRPNVQSFGRLPVEKVRDLAARATVGLIPFVQNDWILERSYPLKAFEYIAAGLPVVTVPVKSLLPFGELFHIADDAASFERAMRDAAPTRHDPASRQRRAEAARKKDYDVNFRALLPVLTAPQTPADAPPLNVLVLYDDRSTHVNTILEHLQSFAAYSRHQFAYAACTGGARAELDLSIFDVIVLHYSVRVSLADHLSPHWAEAIRAFGGYKILFAQDEYDTTETARQWITRLGIHLMYTCVPEPFIAQVYPPARFPAVEFLPTLTGFVPERLERDVPRTPPGERTWIIGYRGRRLPYWYGRLGQEKVEIGRRMKAICAERGIAANIEWDDEHRIYGPAWYEFLEDCRATLGTESGANIFDDTGSLRAAIENTLAADPNLSFDDAFERFLKPHEGRIRMNQVSPRLFEAIAMRTALVLYEGEYSGVVEPGTHFIPLRKDWSNIDEVLEKVMDDALITAMTERAYRDVIRSGRYSFRRFVRDFDEALEARVWQRATAATLQLVAGGRRSESQAYSAWAPMPGSPLRNAVTTLPLTAAEGEQPVLGPHAASGAAAGHRFSLGRLLRQRLPMLVWNRMPPAMRKIAKSMLAPIKPLAFRFLGRSA